MFLELVQVGRGTRDVRRTATRAALLAAGGDEAEVVLQRLSGSSRPQGGVGTPAPVRLLVVRQGVEMRAEGHAPQATGSGERGALLVDVVHDALIEEWATLQQE
jgi:hypothetical protein